MPCCAAVLCRVQPFVAVPGLGRRAPCPDGDAPLPPPPPGPIAFASVQVLRHFASLELQQERLAYFASAEGRDDLYRRACALHEPACIAQGPLRLLSCMAVAGRRAAGAHSSSVVPVAGGSKCGQVTTRQVGKATAKGAVQRGGSGCMQDGIRAPPLCLGIAHPTCTNSLPAASLPACRLRMAGTTSARGAPCPRCWRTSGGADLSFT